MRFRFAGVSNSAQTSRWIGRSFNQHSVTIEVSPISSEKT